MWNVRVSTPISSLAVSLDLSPSLAALYGLLMDIFKMVVHWLNGIRWNVAVLTITFQQKCFHLISGQEINVLFFVVVRTKKWRRVMRRWKWRMNRTNEKEMCRIKNTVKKRYKQRFANEKAFVDATPSYLSNAREAPLPSKQTIRRGKKHSVYRQTTNERNNDTRTLLHVFPVNSSLLTSVTLLKY